MDTTHMKSQTHPFSIAITSLGEERTNLGAFRTFVRFVLVWFCRFPLPLGVWEGLRFVVVALPGLFSYIFLHIQRRTATISLQNRNSFAVFGEGVGGGGNLYP